MRPTLRGVGQLLAVLALAVGALGLLLRLVAWPWQYAVAAAAAAHYLLWLSMPALVLAVVLRRRWTSLIAAAFCVAVLALELPAAAPVPATGRRLVVMQTNLAVGSADPDALVRLVRHQHVDLLATEELTVAEQQRLLRSGLGGVLPYRFTRPLPDGGGGLGLWSRFPLHGGQDVPGFWLGVVRADVRVTGEDVTFLGVHLTPPYPYPVARWRREIARLREVLPRHGAVIVAGDFNATVDHAQFRRLLEHGYADAAEQSGAGYLPSYPNDRWYGPVVAIDHVLMRGGVRARDARTLDLPGSDHRALLVPVSVTPDRW